MMFRFWSAAYVRHLEAEIQWLRLERQKESQRANDAIAALVSLKTEGQANLLPRPLIADRERDVAGEVADLFADAEFSQAGT